MPETSRGPKFTLTWKADELQKKIERQLVRNLYRTCATMANDVKMNISVPTDTAGPSKPGEFPHADTGTLRNSIMYDVDEEHLSGIVGTPLLYGFFLEFETVSIKDRSFLRRTFYENLEKYKGLLLTKLGQGNLKVEMNLADDTPASSEQPP